MSVQPPSDSGEEFADPYAPPTADLGDPWSTGNTKELSLRRDNRRDEAYVKGLAITNVLYFLFFGMGAVVEIQILILHLMGHVSAPWLLRPARFTVFFLTCCTAIAAFVASLGFLRRKIWGLWIELALAAFWFSSFALEPLIRSASRQRLELLGLALANLALAAPILSAWNLRRSPVFSSEYSDAIAATRQIRVRPKLPLKLMLAALALFVAGGVLVIVSASS